MKNKYLKAITAVSMVLMMLIALSLPCFAAPIKLTVDLYDQFQWNVAAFTFENGKEVMHDMKPGFSGDWTYYVQPNAYYNGVNGCTKIILNYPKPFDGYFIIKSAKHLPLNPGYSYTLNNTFSIGTSSDMSILAYKMYYGDSSNNILYEDEIFTFTKAENTAASPWHTASASFKVRNNDSKITQYAFAVEIAPFLDVEFGDYNVTAFHLAFTDFFFEVDDPTLNPGIFEPPTSNSWDSNKDEMSSIMDNLPNSDDVKLSNVDMSNFRQGLACIKQMFNGLVSKTGLSSLIVFVLTFSLGVYLIGRKVG